MASAAEQLASNLNFSAFAKAEDLKKRIWFTIGALLVYRLGTYIPLPGINPDAFAQAFNSQSKGVLGMFWRGLYWTDERATLPYDAVVLAILSFILLTPPDWLGDPMAKGEPGLIGWIRALGLSY